MKRIFVIATFLFVANTILAQVNGNEKRYAEYPAEIDSTNDYSWNTNLNAWLHKSSTYYKYNNGLISSYESKSLVTNSLLLKWEYTYDDESRFIDLLNYKWVDMDWQNAEKSSYTYSADGNIVTETIYKWVNNTWRPAARMINEFRDGNKIGYTYQNVNKQLEFFNWGKFTLTYENGLLKEMVGYRVADGSLIWRRIHNYEEGKLSERIVSQAINGPEKPVSKSVYVYDKYLLLKEVITLKYNNNDWLSESKKVYFRKIESANKVSICHNDKTIIVAKNAVPAHLGHGDYLGKCKTSLSKPEKVKGNQEFTTTNTFSIFPNPAQDAVKISSINPLELIKRYEVYDMTGKIVLSSTNLKANEATIDITDIPEGIYIINIFGSQIYQKKFIKRK